MEEYVAMIEQTNCQLIDWYQKSTYFREELSSFSVREEENGGKFLKAI